MKAGDLTERVTIQQVTRVEDDYGGHAETWSDLATVWAAVRPLSGRERLEASKLESAVGYRVIIRNRSDVTAGMRVSWRGRLMNIRAVAYPGHRAPFLTMDCEDGVAT